MKLIIVQCIILLHLFVNVQCKCDYFKNIPITVIPFRGRNYETVINDCIGPHQFGKNIVKGLYSRNSFMPVLGKGLIKDMKHLEAISFDGCSTQKLEPHVFVDVPRLSEIFLVNSHIKEIPYGFFNNVPALEKIRIHNNSIEIIQAGAFSNLPTLKKIYAHHNKLKYWNKYWFINSTALEKLDFQYNSLRIIPQHAFLHLPNLSTINFNYNDISTIEPGAFMGIKHLKYLGLRYNRVSNIEPNVFPHNIFVESLFIDANRLNYIPSKTLAKLSVKNITLDGNPWKCPCLENVGRWLRTINGTVKGSKYCKGTNVLQCIHFNIFDYVCVENVDPDLTSIYLDNSKFHTNRNGYSMHCVNMK